MLSNPIFTLGQMKARCRITDNGCWEWLGSKTAYGYGRIGMQGKRIATHRHTYVLAKGPIGEGHEIDHLCRNRACCNPDHLEAVTPYVNNMRSMSMSALHARKTHCYRGHELSGHNLLRDGNARRCRACRNAQRRTEHAKAMKRERRRKRKKIGLPPT